MGDLAHGHNRQQTNGSFAAALLSCVPGSHWWCFVRLASVRDSGKIKKEYLTIFGD